MTNNISDRKRIEEHYHDSMHKERVIQKGHLNAGDRNHYKHFYNLVGDVKGMKLLEVGCGGGWLSIQLAERGAKVYGIDISGELIKYAMQEAVRNSCTDNVVFEKMAVEDMTFEDESFDIVIGSSILHHTDLKIVIPKIYKLIDRAGRGLFVEPLNENFVLKLWRKLTPWRRTPTERALLKCDLNFIKEIFPLAEYHFFGFFSMISMGLLMFFPKSNGLLLINKTLERFDAWAVDMFPLLGQYFAVVVLELKK
jgi:2-polyprenyl-3-methyl-5-hydroxy-6-metoxy-1,4-benzoquinol methylase